MVNSSKIVPFDGVIGVNSANGAAITTRPARKFSDLQKTNIAVKIQSVFRMHRLVKIRKQRVLPQEAVNLMKKKKRMMNGWFVLIGYMLFLAIYTAYLLAQRDPVTMHSMVAGFNQHIDSINAQKGGRWCKAQQDVLTQHGNMLCFGGYEALAPWVECGSDSFDAGASWTTPPRANQNREADRIQLSDVKSLRDAVDWVEEFTWKTLMPDPILWNHPATRDRLYEYYRSQPYLMIRVLTTDYSEIAEKLNITAEEVGSYLSSTMKAYREEAMRMQQYNKVFGGILLKTRRGTMVNCTSDISPLSSVCRDSSLIDKSTYSFPYLEPFANASQAAGCPPFDYTPFLDGYFLLVPSPFFFSNSEIYGSAVLNWIRNLNFVDAATIDYSVLLATYNPQTKVLSSFEIVFTVQDSGMVVVKRNVQAVELTSKMTILRNPLFYFFVIGVLFIGFLMAWDIRLAYREGHLHKYLLKFSNLVTICNLCLYVIGIGSYFNIAARTSGLMNRVNEYKDDIGLDDGFSDNAKSISQIIADVQEQASTIQTYFLTQGFSLFLSLGLLFKYLKFQRRLAIITETLSLGLSDLTHFSIIYITILMLFAALGNMLFGTHIDDFKDFYTSFLTMFTWNMGQFDITELVLVFPISGNFIFWTYSVFVTLIIINMFLAIVVDSFGKVKQRQIGSEDSVWVQLRWIARHMWKVCTHGSDYCSIYRARDIVKSLRDETQNKPITLLQLKILLESKYGMPKAAADEIISGLFRLPKPTTTRLSMLTATKTFELLQDNHKTLVEFIKETRTATQLGTEKTNPKPNQPNNSIFPLENQLSPATLGFIEDFAVEKSNP